MVVDRHSCRLAVLGGLNCVRDGGRDPRQEFRPEWRCARWVLRPRRDSHSGPVAAHEGSGSVMVFQGEVIPGERGFSQLNCEGGAKMKTVSRIVGILLLVLGLV